MTSISSKLPNFATELKLFPYQTRTMHKLLETVFVTKQFINSKNQTVDINSETSRAQCEFLQHIIKENNFKKSLEIGFAYGTSTLAITEAVVENGGTHLVMDKFQLNAWKGNGLELIEQAGYTEQLEFFEEYCYTVLPKLLANGRRFDFAYIDSTKQFDWLLVDFFYIDKLLEIGGIIAFDDVQYVGIKKLFRYISQLPNYKVHSQFPKNYQPSAMRKMSKLARLLPFSKKILKEDILKSDYELGINASCVALIKLDEDKRNWDWHVAF